MLNLLAMNADQLHELRLADIDHMLTTGEITHLLKAHDALWMHSGNPTHPHAKLTSGKCSNGFINTLRVLKHTNLSNILAHQLACKIEQYSCLLEGFAPNDITVGSDHAAATFSYAVACLLGTQHEFCEKRGVKPHEQQTWNRFPIESGQRVLQVEELVTTTATLERVRTGIREGSPDVNVEFFPFVATLIHRSKETHFEKNPIVYLVHYDIEDWEPEECPLCRAGSECIRPKGRENWKKLTQTAA